MMFEIGQRVVCIDDCFPGGYGHEIKPVRDTVYTIRDMVADGDFIGLRFEEIHNLPCGYVFQGRPAVLECVFSADQFRPVTDIRWAHEIVAKVERKQPARAA